jgi:hypothetical protein
VPSFVVGELSSCSEGQPASSSYTRHPLPPPTPEGGEAPGQTKNLFGTDFVKSIVSIVPTVFKLEITFLGQQSPIIDESLKCCNDWFILDSRITSFFNFNEKVLIFCHVLYKCA